MKIFALSPSKVSLNPEFVSKLSKLADVVAIHEKMPILEVPGILEKNTDKILLLSPLYVDWKLRNDEIDSIPNLKAICLSSTSYSWIDTKYAASKEIPVFNGGSYSTNAVAEGAIMMALNTARKVPLVIQNNWSVDYSSHLGFELSGKTAGVIGLGNIGTRVAELCSALGMNVTYWSKNSRDEKFLYRELAVLMKDSDVVFITLAQNPETEGLVTDVMLKSMKQNAIFVSVVHKIYNHNLLVELVKSGKIFGYANEESEDGTMLELSSNIWTGLPIIWYTKESIQRNHEVILGNIKDFLKGELGKRVN